MFLGVFAHGAIGGISWRQSRHAFAHPLDPRDRYAGLAPLVELRDDRLLEQIVEFVGVCCIPGEIQTMVQSVAERPSHLRRVGLRPPAVEFRQVDAAVDEHFHPARSAGLPRPPRRVDPDIHSLHQVLGQQHVVVAQENDMGADILLTNEQDPFLDQRLTRQIGRVRFAGHDELHRSMWIAEQAQEPFPVVQQQVGPLVGRKAAREPQRQCLGIEQAFGFVHRPGRCAGNCELGR